MLHPIRNPVLAVCALGLLFSAATAQVSRNVTLRSTVNPGGSFSDCWGYVDPVTGKEYAILLGLTGTYVLDASNPSSPGQPKFIPGPASTWRDARTYGHYAYVVTEGGGGMQIIDLQNPDTPVLVNTYQPSGVNWSGTHNIAIDLQTGMCYPCGTGGGTHVIDLTNDPVNPTYVTSYTTGYVHDLCVQNGVAHLAEITRGFYRLLDVSNLPTMTTIAFVRNVSACHNAWPTRDDQYSVTTSEHSNGALRVFDIRNQSAPVMISFWRSGTNTSVHNAYIVDRVVHMSYYTEGYRAVDLSDPTNPLELGWYDTSNSTSLFDGNWGCYPFQPSGVVYLSDISAGLLIVKPKASTEEYGAGTAGTGGVVPALHTFGAAYLGNANFKLEVEEANANSNAFFIIGTNRASITFSGLTLLVDTLAGPGAIVGTTTGAQGKGAASIPVPNTAALDGLVLNAQSLVQDPNGPLGLSATCGRTFEVFAR